MDAASHVSPIPRRVLQSSGKSSVLESIVGRDFLPRGSGNQPILICIGIPVSTRLDFQAIKGTVVSMVPKLHVM
jgi:hypothetical protein